jgi:cephalosporin hydroxylase
MTIDEMYRVQIDSPSDMQGHLLTLRELARRCELVVELGVRDGVSTIGLLAGRPYEMISVDIMPSSSRMMDISEAARTEGLRWRYLQADSLTVDLPDGIGLLLIDTIHRHDQLAAELGRHAPRVAPGGGIAMHDTVTFGSADEPIYAHASRLLQAGEPSGHAGLRRAITTFLGHHPDWMIESEYDHCHGLTVIRKSES